MASPVQLSDLPPATIANNADETLLRQGLTDYRCSIALIRNIDISSLTSIPGGAAQSTDLFMIARGGSNYKINFNQVGFLRSLIMWFYRSSAPSGWTIYPGNGDRLLAISDTTAGGVLYDGQNPGTHGNLSRWQQKDTILTISQIPPHTHLVDIYETLSTTSDHKLGSGKNSTIGSEESQATGGGLGHNHGNTWRPAATVGLLAQKDN